MKTLITLLTLLLSPLSFALTMGTQNLWHYNTDFNKRLNNMKQELAYRTPDIMGFQEAALWYGTNSLFQEYVKHTGFNSYFAKTNDWDFMHEGMGIASRYPILQKYEFQLPDNSKFSIRKVAIVKVKTEKGPLVVINVHFSPFGDNESRLVQMEFLKKWIVENVPSDTDLFVQGDFNDVDDGLFFKPLYEIGLKMVPLDAPCTYCSGDNPYIKKSNHERITIDYIFYRTRNYSFVESGRLFVKAPVSDHFGVWAKFE